MSVEFSLYTVPIFTFVRFLNRYFYYCWHACSLTAVIVLSVLHSCVYQFDFYFYTRISGHFQCDNALYQWTLTLTFRVETSFHALLKHHHHRHKHF